MKSTIYKYIAFLVKLQFPYELSFLSVFWISSKSNQKHRLDVVSEVFNRSRSPKTRHREASWLLNSFILDQHAFIYGTREFCITGGSQNDQIRYRKPSMTDTEWMHSFSTYSQETPVKRPPLIIARIQKPASFFSFSVALYSLMRKLNLTLTLGFFVLYSINLFS